MAIFHDPDRYVIGSPALFCLVLRLCGPHSLQLLESIPVRYKLSDHQDSAMNRDNVCLINVYRLPLTGDVVRAMTCHGLVHRECTAGDQSRGPHTLQVVIASTHLLFNNNRGDIKFNQICMALTAIAEARRRHGNAPVVFCGDFNLTPGSPLYDFITMGHLDLLSTDRSVASHGYGSLRRSANVRIPLEIDVAPEVTHMLKDGVVWKDGQVLFGRGVR